MSSSVTTPAPPTGLGNGLIEIAALATLIGSTTAASLTLGNRGAAGLPWAVISIFGALHVVKACVAAITPGWLRDVLGVRSGETDLAVGWSLDLARRHRSRNRIGGAIGIACEILPESRKSGNREEVSRSPGGDLYAVDQLTSEYLNFIPAAEPTDPFKAYVLAEDAYSKVKTSKVAWRDTIGLASAMTKLVELCILWTRGAVRLAVMMGVCWAWFFLGAVLLQSLHISREFFEEQRSHVDLLTGQLPTPIRSGGERIDKVFNHPSLTVHTWERLPYEQRCRVRDLVFALSLYQVHVHPRGANSYEDDLRNTDTLPNIKTTVSPQELGAAQEDGTFKVEIQGVIGDTMLSSAAWMFGSKLTGMDLYDSCVVIFKIGDSDLAVPSARVITDVRPEKQKDLEDPLGVEFPPRGGSNSGGPTVHWNYWVPCSSGDWLHFRTAGLKVRGETLAAVVTDTQITEELSSGKLFNSLTGVEDVKEIVHNSRMGCEILAKMIH